MSIISTALGANEYSNNRWLFEVEDHYSLEWWSAYKKIFHLIDHSTRQAMYWWYGDGEDSLSGVDKQNIVLLRWFLAFELSLNDVSNIFMKRFQYWRWGHGGDWMTHNCPKLEKYLFPGISGCIFDPCTGGPGESSYPEGSEYVWQRGVGSQKCLVRGNFQSIGKGLIKSHP